MRDGQACQSYILGQQICRDGFPVNGACMGFRCFTCGAWSADKELPACLREDLHPRFFDDAGRPSLYRNQAGNASSTTETREP